ncbi:MAG: AAA family ATPase [Thermoplasmata archaeon]|nr:AAA family ATPase [Thermoplasmata archaeon]
MEISGKANPELTFLLERYLSGSIQDGEGLLKLIGSHADADLKGGDLRIGVPMGGLQIEAVRIDGFGPYDAETTIEVKDGLNVVTGPNGVGKTSIIAAVRWCLFGLPNGPHRGPVDHASLLNWGREERGLIEYSVVVDLRWGGSRFRAERRWSEGSIYFDVRGEDGKKISGGLPEGLVPTTFSLMVFMGEVVMFLSSGDPFSEVGPLKRAVWTFTGYDGLEELLMIIRDARDRLYRRLDVSGPEAAGLEESIQRSRGRLDNISEDRVKVERELRTLEVEMVQQGEDYRRSLDRLSRLAGLEEQVKSNAVKAARLNIVQEQLQESLSRAGSEILRSRAEKALENVIEEREERTRRRILYGSFESQASIVREIIRKRECICSTSIGTSGMGRERLEDLLEKLEASRDEVSDFGRELIWTSDTVLEQVRAILAAPSICRADMREYIRDHRACSEALRSISGSGTAVKRELEGCISSIREYERTKARIRTLRDREGDLGRRAEGLGRELDGQRSRLIELMGSDMGRKGIREQVRFLDDATSQLDEVQVDQRASFLSELCRKANDISGPDEMGKYSAIVIDDETYEIGRELSGGGRTVPLSSMSAGERELVSLSVLCAFPAMIQGGFMLDSPFAYMDGARRVRFLSSLGSLSKSVYISIADGVLTDEEFDLLEDTSRELGGMHITNLGGGP